MYRKKARQSPNKAWISFPQSPLTVFNPHPHPGLYLVEAELDKGQVPAGVPVQRLGDRIFFEAELPALGAAGFQLRRKNL